MRNAYKLILVMFLIFTAQLSSAKQWDKIIFSGGAPLNTYQPSLIVPILTEAFKRNNIKFEAVYYPSLRSLISSNVGETDGELHRIYDFHTVSNNKYSNLIRIESELISTWMTIYSMNNIIINSWDDLKNYKIAYYRGRKNVEKFLTNIVPERQITKLTTDKQAFKMLIAKRIDLVFSENIEGQRLIKKYSEFSNIFQVRKVKESKIYSYIHKKHKYIGLKVAKTIEEMKKDGTFSEIITSVNNNRK